MDTLKLLVFLIMIGLTIWLICGIVGIIFGEIAMCVAFAMVMFGIVILLLATVDNL